MSTVKVTGNNSPGEDVGKLEPLHITDEDMKWNSTLGNSLVEPQTLTHRVTIGSSNSILRCTLKRVKNSYLHKNLHTNVHSNIVYNRQTIKTGSTCPSPDERKLWYIHIMEYYMSAKKE
jgi:hypothetical protein